MKTNIAFLRALFAHASVRAGAVDTGFIERELDALLTGEIPVERSAA